MTRMMFTLPPQEYLTRWQQKATPHDCFAVLRLFIIAGSGSAAPWTQCRHHDTQRETRQGTRLRGKPRAATPLSNGVNWCNLAALHEFALQFLNELQRSVSL